MRLVNWVRPLGTLMVGAGLLAAGCKGEPAPKAAPPPREVEVLTLAPSEVRETAEYLGSLLSRQNITVMPQVAGYVRKIHVKPGQQVEAGAPLLDVDAREDTAALQSAKAQQSSADVNLELSRRTLARTRSLYDEGLASAQELEQAVAAVKAAEAATLSATAAVSQRNVQLGFNQVRAPFAGTVGDVLVRLGDLVGANTPLTTLSQADVLEVSVAVPAARARSLTPETTLEILDRDSKVLISSPLFYVAPQADPQTQLVEVKAAFQNTVGLRPNELVRARLVFATRQSLQIPALAVVRLSGQPFALVVGEKDGKTVVERKPVVLGALGATSYVVEAGLSEGDRIAVSSMQALRDGMAVKPRAVARPGEAAAPTTGAAEGGR